MSLKLKELRELIDEQLVEMYDKTASHTAVGIMGLVLRGAVCLNWARTDL